MSLHRSRKRFRLRLPDVVGLLLAGSVVVTAILWWSAYLSPPWQTASGTVKGCGFVKSHFNAELTETRVELNYEYMANGVLFRGAWTGFWPVANSPNALPADRMTQELREGRALVIFYDPTRPERSHPHTPENDLEFVFLLATLGTSLFTGFYLMKVYPRWRVEG